MLSLFETIQFQIITVTAIVIYLCYVYLNSYHNNFELFWGNINLFSLLRISLPFLSIFFLSIFFIVFDPMLPWHEFIQKTDLNLIMYPRYTIISIAFCTLFASIFGKFQASRHKKINNTYSIKVGTSICQSAVIITVNKDYVAFYNTEKNCSEVVPLTRVIWIKSSSKNSEEKKINGKNWFSYQLAIWKLERCCNSARSYFYNVVLKQEEWATDDVKTCSQERRRVSVCYQ